MAKSKLKILSSFGSFYFTVGRNFFSQTIDILMGYDQVPEYANLFLYYYRSQLIDSLQKKQKKKQTCVCKYQAAFQFTDNLNEN